MKIPFINKKYLLEKFPVKGGWTYARIPEISQKKENPFGWIRVCGTIDHYEIKQYHLMPIGNGQLFLPVKAEIRKKIGKGEGDWIHVILFEDNSPIEIPEELNLCLHDAPHLNEIFLNYAENEQKALIDWILSAKKEDTKTKRILKTLELLEQRQKLGDKRNNL